MERTDHGLLSAMEHIAREAARSNDGTRCLVSASPELRESMKRELARLRATASEVLAPRLRVRRAERVGLDDGTIHPGNEFPLGTSVHMVRAAAAKRRPLRGPVRVIVVLAEFSDRKLASGHDKRHFEELFFSLGSLPSGSVREYFREVTLGAVDIIGDVVGPYTLPLPLASYANGASGTGETSPNARTMAGDAAARADAAVDFGPYDNDGDGYVDAFIVIHAGSGAEVTGRAGDIWSHKWLLEGGPRQVDGTRIYAYLTVPEDSRIGVCCHELGHLLFGFPDLYDPDGSSEGVGDWCLMGAGSWGGGGHVPCHPSAWCKAAQGWAEVEVVHKNRALDIEDVKTGNKIYRLWQNGSTGSEYFLLENRQRARFDQSLPGAGLLLWHIDDEIPGNENERHYRVALVQADAKRDLEQGSNRGDAGDPFAGAAGKPAAIDADTTPSTRSYGGVDTSVAITEIPPTAAVMSVRVAVEVPREKKRTKPTKKKRTKPRRRKAAKSITPAPRPKRRLVAQKRERKRHAASHRAAGKRPNARRGRAAHR